MLDHVISLPCVELRSSSFAFRVLFCPFANWGQDRIFQEIVAVFNLQDLLIMCRPKVNQSEKYLEHIDKMFVLSLWT